MADPVTLATISIGGSAAGGILGAVGSFMGGQSKKDMYNYQAGISQMNQKIQKQNSDYAIRAGEREARITGTKGGQLMGKIKTAQAASGLDINTGSGVDVRDSQQSVIAQDQNQIRENAGRKAYAYRVGAMQEGAQASIQRQSGALAEVEGTYGAASSLIGGATSVAGKWLQASNAGIYGATTRPSYDSSGNYY